VKFNRYAVGVAVVAAAALSLTACSSGGSGSPSTSSSTPSASAPVAAAKVDPSLTGTITSGGSSAQANAEAAWTAAFTAQASGVTINYDKSQGSGGGVTNWLNGSYDFAGSDAPLTAAEQTQSQTICGPGGALDIPAYLSGVNIIYNLPGVTSLKLDSEVIAKIFSKSITTWNDPAIAALNSGVTLPSNPITVVVRSDGSGTTDNFTTYLHDTQPSIWTNAPSTAWPITGESGQQGGTGVVNAVKAGSYTIGYADQSSATGVPAAAVEVGSTGKFVKYSASGATNAFAAAATTTPSTKGDLTQTLDYTKITNPNSYPIPLQSYQILCTTFKSAAQAKLTKAYIGFVATAEGQAISAKNAGSAPLPAKILAAAQNSLKLVK
jgi:phosphate transport system substrate-binding protein